MFPPNPKIIVLLVTPISNDEKQLYDKIMITKTKSAACAAPLVRMNGPDLKVLERKHSPPQARWFNNVIRISIR